uniref:NHL repeat protein n=1 Tax=Bursaphelenchus xylophilus TaxID=6326 RepID=A0A1I7SH22_BURXY
MAISSAGPSATFKHNMAYRQNSLNDIWMGSDFKGPWENNQNALGKPEQWREAAESDDDEKSCLHLPHFMAVELDEPCYRHRDYPSTRSFHRAPRVQCTGDQPSFYEPQAVKAPPPTLPPFLSGDAHNIWTPEGPLMTSTPRVSAFTQFPGQDSYSSFAEYSSAQRADRNNSFFDGYGTFQQSSQRDFNPIPGPRYAPYLMPSNPTSNMNTSNTIEPSPANRRKMVYIEKFGGFGGNCGEFTEPSGVCVNPRTNDIVIADTNNHRVQIFDQHGNFKFMFGKCGRWDGQFMYPNR